MFENNNSFSYLQLSAMDAAGAAVEIISAETEGHDDFHGPREFVVFDGDEGLAVTIESGDSSQALPFHEIWDGVIPQNGADYGDLPVVHVGTVSTSAPLDTQRDDYYLYRLADPGSEETRGVIIAGHMQLQSELLPPEQAGPDYINDDSEYVEVTEARPVTGYYITDANGAHIVAEALTAALRKGTELPPLSGNV